MKYIKVCAFQTKEKIMHYNIIYSCISDTGKIRKINQDNFICNNHYMNADGSGVRFPLCGRISSKTGALFGVFDGMGGEEYGEIAAFIAAKNSANMNIGQNIIARLSLFCKQTNQDICTHAFRNNISSMGTTAAMIAFIEDGIFVCNIGDSKIFRLSNGTFKQISKDHTAVSPFGVKPPLSQHLGIHPDEMIIEPHFAQGAYNDEDVYLICSDGLTDMVPVEEIKQILSDNSVEAANMELLRTALLNGGHDNITALICKIERVSGGFLRHIIKTKKEG